MRESATTTRLWALLLGLTLLVPDPVHALRQLNAGAEEKTP